MKWRKAMGIAAGRLNLSETNNKITVKLLFFGAARDAVGHSEVDLVLETTSAAQAFAEVIEKYPGLRRFGRSLLLAVNQEYVQGNLENRLLQDGDELAMFPPVSGGASENQELAESADSVSPSGSLPPAISSRDFVELTTKPIDVGDVARRVVPPECGATVTLDGYAREWTAGRRTLYLVYEAYLPMARRELERLADEAHRRFEIAHIGLVHRTGRLEIGETSVVIAVSAPHRRAAFEACEWAIRELKRTVPIWKKEIFEDGEVWVEGEGSPSTS
jgi:molybdopterin synthase catalytic subunit